MLSGWSVTAAVAAAALARGILASDVSVCADVGREAYSREPTPFGWPLTPTDFDFVYTNCWNKTNGGYASCGGVRQSPINIESTVNVEVGGLPGALYRAATFKSGPPSKPVKVSSYLRSVIAEGNFGTLQLRTVHEDEVFVARQVHLTSGSLHSIDGQYFDAEMQIVYFREGHNEGLEATVIVSVLFQETTDPALASPIFTQMGFGTDPAVLPQGTAPSWNVPGIDLNLTAMPAMQGDAWLYNGSVPVPPCDEVVKWFVTATVQKVHSVQRQHLRTMLSRFGGFSGTAWTEFPSQLPASGARQAAATSATVFRETPLAPAWLQSRLWGPRGLQPQ